MITADQIRLKTGIIVLVLLCLLSTGRFVKQPPEGDFAPGRKITITEYEHRFDSLKEVLPERGVVGYLGNGPREIETPSYFLTQYVLAPLVVDRSPDHQLVVGNSVPPALPDAAVRPADLTPVRDFGNGVVLFEKRTK